VHLVGFVIRIYHDARSPERQNPEYSNRRTMFLFISVSNNFILLLLDGFFYSLAFLRAYWLLLCGDQRKQVTRCINSQFNKFSNNKQKVHRTCCRYSSLTKVRYIVMLSAPQVYPQTKTVTKECLLKSEAQYLFFHNTILGRMHDAMQWSETNIRSRRRDGLFNNASPDLPKWFV